MVPWCPPITSSTGPVKLQITQAGNAISGTYTWEGNNPRSCVPATSDETLEYGLAGTVDRTSFEGEISYSGIDDDDGTVITGVIGSMYGSVGEDGVMNFTAIVPTTPKHDHYPEYAIDSMVTAQLRRVPSVSVTSLWPPNHKMVDVGLLLDAATTFIVYSDEDDPGEPDAEGSLLLRAERLGTGDGRVYLIAITAADGGTNTCLTAVVPKSQSARDIASVNAQAAAAMAQCPSPAGYFMLLPR
ncbi:MAG: hypothetical protein ACJ74H_16525 [Thermoanaerobaculia bacterium]